MLTSSLKSNVRLAIVIRSTLLAGGVAVAMAPWAVAPAVDAGPLPMAVCEADPSFAPMGPAGNVFKALVWDDGTGDALYTAGQFLAASDAAVNRIGKWDGTNWHPLGAGFNGAVVHLAVWNDGSGEKLYVVGKFSRSGAQLLPGVASWDGNEWQLLAGSLAPSLLSAASAALALRNGTALLGRRWCRERTWTASPTP